MFSDNLSDFSESSRYRSKQKIKISLLLFQLRLWEHHQVSFLSPYLARRKKIRNVSLDLNRISKVGNIVVRVCVFFKIYIPKVSQPVFFMQTTLVKPRKFP